MPVRLARTPPPSSPSSPSDGEGLEGDLARVVSETDVASNDTLVLGGGDHDDDEPEQVDHPDPEQLEATKEQLRAILVVAATWDEKLRHTKYTQQLTDDADRLVMKV